MSLQDTATPAGWLEQLAQAYQALLQAAGHYHATVPAQHATRPAADWKLVHIALSDALIMQALQATARGAAAVLNNRLAQDDAAIQQRMHWIGTATHMAQLERHSARLLHHLRGWDGDLWQRPVRVLLHNRQLQQVADRTMTWQALIALRAGTHLPEHTAQLQGWARQAVGGAAP